jgi:hypothetical protein
MWKVARRPIVCQPILQVLAVSSMLGIASTPGVADIAPESGLLAHVQTVSGTCETSITDCEGINRSTSQDGPVEFLIFFMRGDICLNQPVCLQHLEDRLSWPPAWQVLEFEACGPGYGGLDPSGTLSIDWYYWYEIGGARTDVLPVARLVMNVVGPGRLDIVGAYQQSYVVISPNCSGSTVVTHPSAKFYAEAGMSCGHINSHCLWGDLCEPMFLVSELCLSAPAGGCADSTVGFTTRTAIWWQTCPIAIDTHAPWCTAWVEGDYGVRSLHVTADAIGLPPGIHETAIELANIGVGVSRCLPLVFTVEESMATSPGSWGRVKALYR